MFMWRELPLEITGLKTGIIGLGVSGAMIAEALMFMGADARYYSRTRKEDREAAGLRYQPLDQLLRECDVVFTCLNKNAFATAECILLPLPAARIMAVQRGFSLFPSSFSVLYAAKSSRQHRRILGNGIWTRLPWFQSGRHEVHGS